MLVMSRKCVSTCTNAYTERRECKGYHDFVEVTLSLKNEVYRFRVGFMNINIQPENFQPL